MLRVLAIFLVVLAGCAPQLAQPILKPTLTLQPSPLPTASATVTPPPTSLPSPTGTATPAALQVCSPLADFSFEKLRQAVVNPYDPPALGRDEPHHGVDLASVDPQTRIALAGWPVQAVLGGTVVGVINERFPYGNALIVETALDGVVPPLQIPVLAPTPAIKSPLLCPDVPLPERWPSGELSLYLLYAHLQNPTTRQAGEVVACGSPLGEVGMSGNALNPHLHLEVRIGPAGERFSSMAHYDASASNEEMGTYCQWRISGWFQPLDPMQLFNLP
jgi:murein DD-endopeptidase MepM/ murein hydrolase activator NlpD